MQVVCNGGVAGGCGLIYLATVGMKEVPLSGSPDIPSLLSLAILSALSCSCGDTWASEIGSVIGGQPRLITNFRPVPVGTNGGITMMGVVSSVAGGSLIGLTHFLSLLIFWREEFHGAGWGKQLDLMWVGAASGFIGSLIDSIFGATLQFSGYSEKLGRVVSSPGPGVRPVAGSHLLDNHSVNLLSSLLTAILIPALWAIAHSF